MFGDDWERADKVILGGFELPGIARVKPKLSRKLDKKSAANIDGGTIRDKGYLPAKISIKVVWWLPEQEAAWAEIIPIIHPRIRPDRRDPIAISCAACDFWGIYEVVVESIEGPEKGQVEGSSELTIECVEWAPEPQGQAAGAKSGNNVSDADFDRFMQEQRQRPSESDTGPNKPKQKQP